MTSKCEWNKWDDFVDSQFGAMAVAACVRGWQIRGLGWRRLD